MSPTVSELRSEAGEGPASSEVEDRLGSPSGAAGFFGHFICRLVLGNSIGNKRARDIDRPIAH